MKKPKQKYRNEVMSATTMSSVQHLALFYRDKMGWEIVKKCGPCTSKGLEDMFCFTVKVPIAEE